MTERLCLQITDVEDVQRASDILHDARFSPSNAQYDPEKKVFSLMLVREVEPELVPTRFSWLWRIVREPVEQWARCSLTFRQVERAEISVEEQFECLLTALSYDAATGVTAFDVMGPVRIALHVRELNGELTDLGNANTGGKTV